MGLFSGIGKLLGSAVGAVGKVAGIIPGIGPAISAAAGAASSVLKGGSSTSTSPGGQTLTISGQAPPAAPATAWQKFTSTKLLGVPLFVWALGAVAVVVFLIWRRKRS